jgi:hypothetical protein
VETAGGIAGIAASRLALLKDYTVRRIVNRRAQFNESYESSLIATTTPQKTGHEAEESTSVAPSHYCVAAL